jgi:hypothetical protein
MLTTYPEIRDRIYTLARRHGLQVEWVDVTRDRRVVLLYDSRRLRVAKAQVPLRRVDPDALDRLGHNLEEALGEGWWLK